MSEEKSIQPSDQARAMVSHVQEKVRARHAELCKVQNEEAVFLSNRSVSKTMKEVPGLEDHLSRMRHSRQVRGGHKVMDEWSHQEGTRAQLLDFHSKKKHIIV